MSTDTAVIRSVVRILGALGLILAVELGYLAHRVIEQGAGTKSIDPAAVAIVGAIGTAFAGVAGYIGGLLSSTRSAGAGDDLRREERDRVLSELEDLATATPPAKVDTAVVNADNAVVNAGERAEPAH